MNQQITIYVTDVVDGWIAWNGLTWDEESGAVLDSDREQAIERFKATVLKRQGIKDLSRIQFNIQDD